MKSKLQCEVCYGYSCKGEPVVARCQFAQSRVLNASVKCADKVIAYVDNEGEFRPPQVSREILAWLIGRQGGG